MVAPRLGFEGADVRTDALRPRDRVFGLDLDGRVTFVNPAAARMLGYAVDELVGGAMHPMVHHTYPDGTPYPFGNTRATEWHSDQ